MLKSTTERDRLAGEVESARTATLAWLATMQAEGAPRGIMRISAAHDAGRWPGMLVPGTYNGIMCLDLIGGLESWTAAERRAAATWLEGHRLQDGRFRLPGMKDDEVFKKPMRRRPGATSIST